MRHVYVLGPDAGTAQQIAHALERLGVPPRRIHLAGGRGASIAQVHPATFAQRTDVVSGLLAGLVVGGSGGFLGAWLAYAYPPGGLRPGEWILWVTSLVGALCCGLVCALFSMDRPNRRLRRYGAALCAGWLLLIVDVPRSHAEPIIEQLRSLHRDPRVQIMLGERLQGRRGRSTAYPVPRGAGARGPGRPWGRAVPPGPMALGPPTTGPG